MAKARKMLSDWEAPYLQPLVKLIETQSKETLSHWAINYSDETILPIWSKRHPGDPRLQNALNAARAWLAGTVKLPPVKAAILECHAAAREAENDPTAQAAARAVGQSASTVHAARHCVGLALYGALAVAYDALGAQVSWSETENAAAAECRRMLNALRAIAVEDEPHPAKISWKC